MDYMTPNVREGYIARLQPGSSFLYNIGKEWAKSPGGRQHAMVIL